MCLRSKGLAPFICPATIASPLILSSCSSDPSEAFGLRDPDPPSTPFLPSLPPFLPFTPSGRLRESCFSTARVFLSPFPFFGGFVLAEQHPRQLLFVFFFAYASYFSFSFSFCFFGAILYWFLYYLFLIFFVVLRLLLFLKKWYNYYLKNDIVYN